MIKNTTEKSLLHLKSPYSQHKEKVESTKDLKETKDPSADRLASLQNQIQKGEYKIDLKKTSEKMALNLLNLP